MFFWSSWINLTSSFNANMLANGRSFSISVLVKKEEKAAPYTPDATFILGWAARN